MGRNARFLFGLLLFNGISAVGGGIALMTGVIPKQASWLQHTDFASMYFPGVILTAMVGGSSGRRLGDDEACCRVAVIRHPGRGDHR